MPHFKKDIEALVLVPSDGGRFEVYAGEDRVHSKLETGRFPEPREIIKLVESRM